MTHIPVLLGEVMALLDPKPGEFIVDGTLGEGGYSELILERIGEKGRLLATDLDPTMIEKAKRHLGEKSERMMIENQNFSEIPAILEKKEMGKPDGVVLDLGFASDQIEESGRGFSFRKDEPLLMTYNDTIRPLKDRLPELKKDELAKIIKELSGERFAERIARAIKEREIKQKIETSGELAGIVAHAVSKRYENGRIHPATRTFLALRMWVNSELDHVKRFLETIPEKMNQGGRIVIVTFQSSEDRLVKQSFRDLAKSGKAVLLNKKPLGPGIEEIKRNPRARSAKVRAIQIL